jgi:hypothetical protein
MPEYQEIPKKYHLIDLYDSKHNGFELNSGISQSEIEKRIDDTIREKKHQAFIFHKVGNKNILDHLRKILKNFNYTFDEDQLLQLIQYLDSKKNQIWIAPLVQIYKYEEEFKSSELKILNKDERVIILKLKIDTDPNLYDQELTLLLPRMNNKYPTGVLQNTKHLEVLKSKNKEFCSYIKPLSCEIQVMYD